MAATGDAFTYAVALADLEALRPTRLRCAVAANGGQLADRIARVLGQTRAESQTSSAPGAASVILLAITACVVFGQSAERSKFEVASIKEVHELRNSAGLRPSPGGRLIVDNYTVRGLIRFAYQLQDFQVVGGPNWLRDVGFDIEAKADPTTSREQLLLMLQPLLEERFHLRYHRETRELPVYALTVVKRESKLPIAKGACVNAPTTPCGGLFIGPTASGMVARGGDVPMPEFIRSLSRMLRKPVLDQTGITTHFDVRLEFTADDTVPGFSGEFGNVAGHNEMMAALRKASDDAAAAPNILVALQQQLGLKLEATSGPAEVMVIDSVEKPGPN